MATDPKNIIMLNDRAVYARYRVLADVPDGMPKNLADTLCIDERMKDIHLEMLAKLGVEKVRVEEIPEPPEMAATRQEGGEPIRYASRTEILEHLQGGIEPKSLELPRLRERLAAAEAEVQTAKQAAQAAEAQARAAEEKAELAETKAIQAEEKALAATEKATQVERLVEEIGRQADKRE